MTVLTPTRVLASLLGGIAATAMGACACNNYGGFFVKSWPGTCEEVRDRVIGKCKSEACALDGVKSIAIKAGESGDPRCIDCLLEVYWSIDVPLGERIASSEAPIPGTPSSTDQIRTSVEWALLALANERWQARPALYDPFPDPPAEAAWDALKQIRPDIRTERDGDRFADALYAGGLLGYQRPLEPNSSTASGSHGK